MALQSRYSLCSSRPRPPRHRSAVRERVGVKGHKYAKSCALINSLNNTLIKIFPDNNYYHSQNIISMAMLQSYRAG